MSVLHYAYPLEQFVVDQRSAYRWNKMREYLKHFGATLADAPTETPGVVGTIGS